MYKNWKLLHLYLKSDMLSGAQISNLATAVFFVIIIIIAIIIICKHVSECGSSDFAPCGKKISFIKLIDSKSDWQQKLGQKNCDDDENMSSCETQAGR